MVNAVFKDISCVLGVFVTSDLGFGQKMVKSHFWVKWSKSRLWPYGFGGLVNGAEG